MFTGGVTGCVQWMQNGCLECLVSDNRQIPVKITPCRVRVFKDVEEENQAEYQRRAAMTPQQRIAEFDELQARQWGRDWHTRPMPRVATWEILNWE